MHYQRLKRYGDPLINKRPQVSLSRPKELEMELFNRRKIKEDGCWEWTRSCGSKGYGQWKIEYKTHSVHRLSAFLFLGFDLSSDLCVLHKCDNPPCFNPDHLFVGTYKENTDDCILKGRRVFAPNAKLTEEDVTIIKKRLQKGETQTAISRDYRVDQTLIGFIHRGVIWKHVC